MGTFRIRGNLTIEEIVAKTDDILRITGDLRAVVKGIREARTKDSEHGRKISTEEAEAIRALSHRLVDSVQAFNEELLQDLAD